MKLVPILAFTILFLPSLAHAQTYEHDKWVTIPRDHIFTFEAFVTSFDGTDDNNGDADADAWGIPEWVAFEIKGNKEKHHLAKRPKWTTDKTLASQGVAPTDATYAVSGTRRLKEVKGDYRFVRGHMCPKDTAERVSENAAHETHTVLNAVPQLQWQNNGIWKALENKCVDWADAHEGIWVICGPVFFGKEPAMWLGQDGEKQAAIPDALYKIVVRMNGDNVTALAFLIPNILPKAENKESKLASRLVTVDRIEELTGLDFLTALDDDVEASVESQELAEINW